MKRVVYILLTVLVLLGSACHNRDHRAKKNAETEQVALLRSYREADSIYIHCGRIDTGAFNQFINKALLFTTAYPEQEISPEILYRAGIGSMILAKAAHTRPETAKYAKQALKIFTQFQNVYPEQEKFKYCYWQRAIVYDDILGDSESAKDEYRDFINRYPNDSLTPQFKQYIQLLDKSEAEIEQELNIQP